MEKDIFCKIASGEIPADIVYEDDELVAFKDVKPQAPVHVLIVPRKHISKLSDMTTGDVELLGRIMLAANKIAKLTGIAESGYRVIANNGPDAGQEVYHVHFHVLGGRRLGPLG
ncbi:MAG TPA: histidine triad nucleotide-binding protein [Anaerolineae bacterium]|jgi:histidine triad (HIT) family protein|nr:histidine triad nucleotide-binding protein [Anaerolineae bacterium]